MTLRSFFAGALLLTLGSCISLAQQPARQIFTPPSLLPSSPFTEYAIAPTPRFVPLPASSPVIPWRHWLSPSQHTSTAPAPNLSTARYHWRGLLTQSLVFNLIENGSRVGADRVMRDTLAHRPFWHDYAASMKQFNMGRWNDGDTFIVNYIGHSMHGAVAAYIEMQNSPTDSRIEWGDPGYVRSRFKGLLWATFFSTHSEISPAGEAGIGNEGGFTYGVQCQYHCDSQNFHPGDHYTNNTGWVDFIISPAGGMAWVVVEDFLDKNVSGWLDTRYPGRFWPKVVRGGLSPARSFSNILRWQAPWYRDFQHRDFQQPLPAASRVRWLAANPEPWQRPPRLQIAPYFTDLDIAANTSSCFNCRRAATGSGLQLTFPFSTSLAFDTALSYHPNASPLPSDRAGGNLLIATFGLQATRRLRYNALHFALRPGLAHFTRAYLTSPVTYIVSGHPAGIATARTSPGPGVIDARGLPTQPQLGGITHFVWDVNLSFDYRLSRHLGLRIGVDNNLLRYRTNKIEPPSIGTPPYLSWLSRQTFINRSNYSLQLGPLLSF